MTQHWVEELFPPTFKYNNLGELLTNDKRLQEIDKTKYEQSHTSRTTEPIENIYERVRTSYNVELEARRQKCIQVGNPLKKSSKQKPISESQTTPKSTNEDPCLWTNHEMKILREAYQTLKIERMKVVEELKVMKKAFNRKEEKVKQYRKNLKEQCESLRSLNDGKLQLEIVNKNTNKELEAVQSVEVFLREDITDLENQKHSQQKVIEVLKKDLAQERRTRKQISLELEQIQQKYRQESELREDEIRLDFEIQIKHLYKEIDKLVKELDKEKNDHVISKKGLDHLRAHFTGTVELTSEANISELKNFSLY